MTLARRYEWSGTPFKARAEPCRGAFSGYAMPPTPCPRGGGGGRGRDPLDAKGSPRVANGTGGRGELFGAWGHPLFSLFSSNQSPHTPADPKGSAD